MRTCSARAEGERVAELSRSAARGTATPEGMNKASAMTALIVCAIKNVIPSTNASMIARRDVIVSCLHGFQVRLCRGLL
jgi:hypothetical protein